MRLYLCGPMTGYSRWNFDAFEKATADLRAAGYNVHSPAEHELDKGFDPDAPVEGFTAQDYRDALLYDLEVVACHVDGVALLDGWNHSNGAKAEVALALALGLTVAPVNQFLTQEVLTK